MNYLDPTNKLKSNNFRWSAQPIRPFSMFLSGSIPCHHTLTATFVYVPNLTRGHILFHDHGQRTCFVQGIPEVDHLKTAPFSQSYSISIISSRSN
ncbi:hypothetical protein MTR_3g113150 [Medicago truncatula]|uniref:Uncharacterized protein n=1 Tax=Medicago truncatula TaxID=3880 RepID=G7J4P2_MEDTR|nr:hypothetical protein MTR_3g113150 [Medicago truncatula]